MKKIVIATRGSALALWQAEYIGSRLPADRAAGILILKTKGDVLLDAPLAQLGGKGLFVKEIEDALLDGRADLAVHSMKDVPMALPPGLTLAAMPERGASGDLFLSERFPCLDAMPEGAALGTSSLRRQAQALALRPDLTVTMLRGNVETRLRKMKEGRFDAIILAEAGMVRLGLGAKYHEALTLPRFVSAVGQGALGVEIREDRRDLARLLAGLDHGPTRLCVEAERAFLAGLNGGCQTPIGGRAELKDGDLILEGMVAAPDGGLVLRRAMRSRAGDAAAARDLGRSLAEAMLAGGARTILDSLYARGDSTL